MRARLVRMSHHHHRKVASVYAQAGGPEDGEGSSTIINIGVSLTRRSEYVSLPLLLGHLHVLKEIL